jgi:ribose/xylose/arabinose/galactoside ABC-type transport system permease subunit
VCVVFGFLNGFLVTTVRLPAFSLTLGTYRIALAPTCIGMIGAI